MGKDRFKGYTTAAGCMIVMFMHLGFPSAVGIFIPRIAKEFGVPTGRISICVSFCMAGAFLTSFFLARLIRRVGAKKVIMFASFALTAQNFIYFFTTNIIVLWLANVLVGIALGLGSNVANASILASWFIKKRSAIVGMVFGGAAFGGALFQLLGGMLCARFSWRISHLILGLGATAVALLANLILIRDPAKLGQKPLGHDESLSVKMGERFRDQVGVTFRRALRSPSMWLLFAGMITGGFLITGFQTFAPSFWQENGMAAVTSSAFLSLWSLLGAVGVIAAGQIAERLGNKGFIAVILVSYIAGMFLAIRYGADQAAGLVVLSCVFVGLAYPASTSIPATVTTGAFGQLDYARICSMLMAGLYLGKGMVSPVLSILSAKTGGLMSGFILLIAFGALTLILCQSGLLTAPFKATKKR